MAGRDDKASSDLRVIEADAREHEERKAAGEWPYGPRDQGSKQTTTRKRGPMPDKWSIHRVEYREHGPVEAPEGYAPIGFVERQPMTGADTVTGIVTFARKEEGGRRREAMIYVVVGRYCATDANPETDAEDRETAEICESRADAETMLLWYPGGTIIPVRPEPEASL